MTTYRIGELLSKEDMEWYGKANKDSGMKPTGETLNCTWSDGTSMTYVVFKGTRTPYGYVRDCGNHYIIARYSSYTRIDKGTMKVTEDVNDR